MQGGGPAPDEGAGLYAAGHGCVRWLGLVLIAFAVFVMLVRFGSVRGDFRVNGPPLPPGI